MQSFWRSIRQFRILYAASMACSCLMLASVATAHSARQTQAAAQSSPQQGSQQAEAPVAQDNAAVFEKRIPASATAFLSQFAGAPAVTVVRDKRFRKLMRGFVPDCMFHYGRDMSLSDALDLVMNYSPHPVQIRDGRYVIISGRPSPYLEGRAFLWVDTQEGIGLGGFYFHPTNGEPTPTIAVFSRQVRTKDKSIGLSQLPSAFVTDLNQWAENTGLPVLATTYFITGSNTRILLEHDEDYCASGNETPLASSNACEQMNADAADLDLTAAYYLRDVHYATNATAWMASGELTDWIRVRDGTCGTVADPLACRFRMTRQHVRVIVGREPPPPPRRPPPIR